MLVSGGLDSAVLLHWAAARAPVATLTLDRPDRPRGERRAAEALLDHYRVAERFLLSYPGGDARWSRGTADRGWIPGRNLFQWSAAALVARRAGARSVAGAHLAPDAEEFPDARRSFFDRLERLANVEGGPPLLFLTPFLALEKRDVALLARTWGVPVELTWSCYRDGPRPCDRCRACRERREAMRLAPRDTAASPAPRSPEGASERVRAIRRRRR